MLTFIALLTAFNPIGINLRFALGVPSGPVAAQVVGVNEFSPGVTVGDDRRVGLELNLISMPGIAPAYRLGFTGISIVGGVDFGRFGLALRTGGGIFRRSFATAKETGVAMLMGAASDITVVESSAGSLSLGVNLTAFPSGRKSIILYGVELNLTGLVWK